jgi:hypothetical protein
VTKAGAAQCRVDVGGGDRHDGDDLIAGRIAHLVTEDEHLRPDVEQGRLQHQRLSGAKHGSVRRVSK